MAPTPAVIAVGGGGGSRTMSCSCRLAQWGRIWSTSNNALSKKRTQICREVLGFRTIRILCRGRRCRFSHRCTPRGGPYHRRNCQTKGYPHNNKALATQLKKNLQGHMSERSDVRPLPMPIRIHQLSQYLTVYNAKKVRFNKI